MRTSRVSLTSSLDIKYDGDTLAGILLVEWEMVKAMRRMSTDNLIWDRNTGRVSEEIGVSKDVAQVMNRFLGVL
jgi:hypothetical protein